MPYLEPEEEKVFGIIYEKYKRLMYHVIYEILKDKEDSEDVLQESFIRVAKNMEKIVEPVCPQTKNFVVIISRNAALSFLKRNRREIPSILSEEIHDERIEMDPQKIADEKETTDIVVEAIHELSYIYRDCLYMQYVEEYNAKEISELLTVPLSTVRKRLQRGTKMLRKELRERGVSYEDK